VAWKGQGHCRNPWAAQIMRSCQMVTCDTDNCGFVRQALPLCCCVLGPSRILRHKAERIRLDRNKITAPRNCTSW
jgi:hypothetical protein